MSSDQFPAAEQWTRCTEHSAAADLQAVLQLVAAGRVRCSVKTLRPTAASVAAVAEVLQGGDFYAEEPIAAFAWPLLLQSGGLAELAGGKLTLTTRGRTALTATAHQTLARLWQRWLGGAVLDEFSRVEVIKGQRAANVLSAARPRRAQVAAALAGLAPDEWIPVDELFAAMRRAGHDPVIERTGRALWKLYLEDPQYGSLGYDGFHNWELLQGRYTLAVLFEYAAPLGLIDVRYVPPVGARDDYHGNWGADDLDQLSRYDGLLALRLTPLGTYATGAADSYAPAPAPAQHPVSAGLLKVLHPHDLVALDGLPPAQALLLDAYAHRAGERTWSLTPASLLAAIDAGREVTELRGYLDRAAANPMPETVATLLEDAEHRCGQVRDLGPVHLIECAEEATAALLATDRRLRTLATRVGERHFAVPADKHAAFRKAALKLGYPLT